MKSKLISIILCAVFVCGCSEKYIENWPELRTDYNEFIFPSNTDKSSFNIYYLGDWTLDLDGKDWITADKSSGNGVTNVILNFSVNNGLSRAASLTIHAGEAQKIIPITQKSGISNPKIMFAESSLQYPNGAYEVNLAFDTNIPGEYLQNMVIAAKDAESGLPVSWLSDIVVSPKEDPVPPERKEEFPTGVRHYISAKIENNLAAEVRDLNFSIFCSDAAGVAYTDTIKMSQTAESAFIKIQEKDMVNKLGGNRTVSFSTNLDAVVQGFLCNLSYEDPDLTGFVSDVSLDGKFVKYNLSENTTNQYRYASISLSYTDLNGTTTITEPSLLIEQNIFSGSFENVEFTSANELLAWNASYDLWKDTDKIKLGADIDMKGQTLICRDFTGTFDGKGHKIYNFNIEGTDNLGFFASLAKDASVSNLVLGSADGNSYDGFSSIVVPSTGTTNAGGLAGLIADNAKVSNVTSFVSITAENLLGGNINVGGLVGLAESAGLFAGCENNGVISINGGTLNNLYAGGVVGSNKTTALIIDNCLNTATIIASATASSIYIGGILGNASVATELSGCTNTSNITVNGQCTETFSSPTTTGNCRVAGIVGSCAAAVKVGGCLNNGSIEVISNTSYANIAGVMAVNTNSAAIMTGCVNNGFVKGTPVANGANQVVRIAGMVALSTISGTTMVSCENYGDLQLDNDYQIWRNWIGGAAGYCKAVIVSGGKFKSSLTRGSISAGQIGVVVAQDDTSGGRVENNGVGGNLNGTVITEENYNNPISNIVAKKSGSYSPDLTAAGNYFLKN